MHSVNSMSVLNDVYFWRQMCILSTFLFDNLSLGMFFAFPSVLNAAILNPNTTDIKVTFEEASWITASSGVLAIPSNVILPIIMQCFGRKIVTLAYFSFRFIGWCVFVFAHNATALLAARIVQGFALGSGIIQCITLAEYTHPSRRGYILTTKKVFFCIGGLLCHSLYLCFSWRKIAFVAATADLISIFMVFIWPESPAFLAMKKKFEQCEKSFVWLHGNESSNHKELIRLIASQKIDPSVQLPKQTFKNYFKTLLGKDFRKGLLSGVLLGLLFETTGSYTFPAFLMQILIDLFGDMSIGIYVTIGNDVLNAVSSLVAVIAICRFKRRTLLFYSGGLSVILLFTASSILFVKTYSPMKLLDWMTAVCILIFNLISNIGVITVIFALLGELFPLKFRGVGASIVGVAWATTFTIFIKVTPSLLKYTGTPGTFIVNAILALVCLIILYFILPETKDKSLIDIENEMKGEEHTCEENDACNSYTTMLSKHHKSNSKV